MTARWINFCKYFFNVIRCCRDAVHDHAKLAKEDDYYNMVKVILCSILFSFFFKVIINNDSIILFVLTF